MISRTKMLPNWNYKIIVLLCLTVGLNISCHQELPETITLAYNHLPKEVDFNFHIRPILSDRCYTCHGPDENAQQ